MNNTKGSTNKLRFGVPGGTLAPTIEKLFQDAGYNFHINEELSLVSIDDDELDCFFDKTKGIATFIHQGSLDAGIVSRAALAETKADVEVVGEIGTQSALWSETKAVLAVPEDSPLKTVQDLQGKKIITRIPHITQEFLQQHNVEAIIEFSDTNNEAKVPALADALIEYTHTGTTLRFYHLKALATVLERANIISVVAHKDAMKDPWKREKLGNLTLLLKGARIGQEMVGLTLHASNDMMERVLKILPSLKKPTVTHLRGENWFDVFTVANKEDVRRLIPQLKHIGCTDIVEFPLNKVII